MSNNQLIYKLKYQQKELQGHIEQLRFALIAINSEAKKQRSKFAQLVTHAAEQALLKTDALSTETVNKLAERVSGQPVIINAALAVQNQGKPALIGSQVVFVSEVLGNGDITLKSGVIIDELFHIIDEPDWQLAILFAEVVENGEENLYPIFPHEQIALIPFSQTEAGQQQLIQQLKDELDTANSMHLDNDRYKYEQLGFGSVDELIEHFENAKQQLEQVKLQAKIHASECDTQKAIVRDLCGLLGLRVHDFHCISKAKNALEGRDLISAAKELEAIACSFPKSFSSISCDFLTERASILRNKAKGMAWFSGATKYPAGQCKHGVILYGNECLNCTRESEQGQGGAA